MSQDKIEGQEPDTFDGGIAPEGELETAAQREDEREERLEDAPEERKEALEEGEAIAGVEEAAAEAASTIPSRSCAVSSTCLPVTGTSSTPTPATSAR